MMPFIIFIFFSQFAMAQGASGDLSRELDLGLLKQEGQLVSVRIAIGEPLRIFVVGREEAKLDFSQLKLTVRRIKPYPGEILQLTKHGDYFSVSDTMNLKNETELEVKTKVKNKEETFHFKIDNKMR